MRIEMRVNAEDYLGAAVYRVHRLSPYAFGTAHPNHAEGQDTHGAEQSSHQLTNGQLGSAKLNTEIRSTGQRKGRSPIPARVRPNSEFPTIVEWVSQQLP